MFYRSRKHVSLVIPLVGHVVHKEVPSCVWHVQVSTYHLHPQIYSVAECWFNWTLIWFYPSVNRRQKQSESIKCVRITSTTYPPQAPIMEETTWGRVCVFVWVWWEWVYSLIRTAFLFFRVREYDINLVIYTIAVSPWEVWVTKGETKQNHAPWNELFQNGLRSVMTIIK